MEPEDLPWPGELEEEEEEEAAAEEEEEVEEKKEEVEKPEGFDEDEVVTVEDQEAEERQELDADSNYESQPRESTDDEEDEEAKAWLQAHPSGIFPSPSLPKHRYSESEPSGPEKVVPLTSHVWQQSSYQDKNTTPISDSNVVSLEETAQWGSEDDQKTESWHFLPQEIDSSHTSDTTQTRFKVREEGTEMTDFPSVEEGILTQSENQVKEPNRDLFCSSLLVIQDSFASPDLPLLTCLTQDQEFGPDSLFHQSELDFAPLRAIPGKSEDTEWFSRPSEVSEALFQAASEVASDLVSSHFSVSQHTLTGSTAVESQGSFLHPDRGTKEETVSSGTVDELKTPKDSDSYDALCSCMSWKTQEVTQEPETTLANKDQLSFSTSSDINEEYVAPKESDSFDASCLYVQYCKQKALQQSEKYLNCKDHDSCSDSSDTIDKNKISQGIGNFSAPLSCTPWSEQGVSHHPETYAVSKDHVSFPHEVAPHFNNKMSYSFLHCLLERRGKNVPLLSDSHYFESVYLRAPAENEVKQKMVSLEGYERNEEGLGKELSQCFELKENSNTLVFLELCPSSSEIRYIENVVVPDNSVKVSETHILSREHGISKVETSGGPLQTIISTLDETSEQLYFQEERNQKASAAFGGRNVNATENVAFEAIIASIEPSKKESTGNEIQTDITKSLTNNSQDSEPKNSDLFLLNYNDANSFFDKFSHPHCHSTPGVFEPAASKPLLRKKDDDVSSLDWRTNVKSLPSAPQEMFIRPLSSASLSEKSHSQVVGLCKTQSPVFQCGVDSEPFLPIAEKAGSSNSVYPLKVSTSDSLFLQDLKQRTFEEVADSSKYILGKNVNSSCVVERPSAAVGSSFSANLVAYDAKSQGALPMTNDASLIAVGQETLLKADTGLGEIPRPMGAKSSFTIHAIIQNDSYFVEGLQGKSESDICTLGDDTECCSLDENAVVCSERSTELQREICDQGDLSGECIELACLENLLDVEICDSPLPWQSALQQPFKEESSSEEPVGHSDMDINQSFSSVLPPFVPHEPKRELEYHSSDLRMLRVSLEIDPKTLKHLSGDISEGSVTEITQSNLKAGISTTSGDSDSRSYLPLTTSEDFPQLVVRSSVENTLHLHTDSLNEQILADGHVTEEVLKVLAVPELGDQKTEISTLPSSSYSLREKPSVFFPQPLRDNLTEGALTVSAVPGPADKKSEKTTVPSTSFSHTERHIVFSQQQLPDSDLPEQALKVSGSPGPADQGTVIPTVSSTLYSHGETPLVFLQQTLPGSHLTEQALKVSAAPGSTEQKTGIPIASSTSYSHREKPSLFYQQELPESHLPEQSQQAAAVSIFTDQKTGVPTGTSTSYSHGETPLVFHQQTLPGNHLPEQSQQAAAVSIFTDQKTGIPTGTSTSYSHGETPLVFHQQTLPGSHLPEQALKVSAAPGSIEQKTGIPTGTSIFYSHGKTPLIFHQQTLTGSHLTEQALKVSAAPGSTEQKTGIPIVSSTSYSHREKPSLFYQQTLPESHLPEQSQQAAAVSIFTDQKTGIPTGTSTSYSHGETPLVFHQQTLPGSHLTEQALKVSAAPGSTEQKTGIPIVSSTYSHREKPSLFYQQTLPESHLPEQSQQAAAVSIFTDQKTGIPTGTSTSYSHGETPLVFHQQTLPGSHLTEQALKVSAAPGSTEQKTGIPIVSSTSYSHREKPSLFYQQTLPESHLPEQSQQAAAVSVFTDQKTGIPTGTSTSYSHGETPLVFHQQTLPGSHLPEQSQQAAAASIFTDQKTGIPTGTSTSYSHGETPLVFLQQTLPGSHLPEQALKVSAAPGSTEQKTGIPTGTSTFYSHGKTPLIFHQQTLPGSHLPEQALKVSAAPGSTEQKTGIPIASSTSYSHREKPSLFYQQELPESHLPEQSQQAAAVSIFTDQKTGVPTGTSTSYSHGETPLVFHQQTLPGSHLPEESQQAAAASIFTDQKTGIPTGTSTSYSHGETPLVFRQQTLPGSHLTEQALKVSAAPGSTEQKTGIPIVSSTSYSHGDKPSLFYQQTLPESHLPEQSQQAAAVSIFTDQKTGIPTGTSTSYSHGETPLVFRQQTLPGSHLTEQALKVSAAPGSTEQKTGIPIVSSTSYLHGEKPSLFYQQTLPESHLPEQSQQAAAVSIFTDQKTGIPTGTSTSYSHGETPLVFRQQTLPGSHLTEQALKVSAAPGSTEQKTGIPIVSSTSYLHGEKPSLFYQQTLPESHLPEQSQQAAAVSIFTDQKTGIPTGTSTSYSHGETPLVFHQQTLPGSHLTEQALKVSAAPGSTEQKTGIPIVSSTSYSHREKPSLFYQQTLPESHLPEQSQQAAAVSIFTDKKTVIPTGTSTSYSHGEKPHIFYQQVLPGSHLTEQALKVSAPPGLADQRSGIPTVSSTSYSYTEKPNIIYQQELPVSHLTKEVQKVPAVAGPAQQKTGIPVIPPTSYSHRGKTIFFSQQEFPDSHLSKEALKVSSVLGPAEQTTGIPSGSSGSYSFEEKPSVFYQQTLPDSHLTEESLKMSSVPGDQKTGILIVPSSSNSHREKPSISYQQELPDSHLTEQAQKIPAFPGTTEQKTGIPTLTSASYSHREKPFIFSTQGLPDSHLPEEALKVTAVPGPADQKAGKASEPSGSYSHREKPIIFYPQDLPDTHLTEEALKVPTISGPTDQKTGLPTIPSTSYPRGEKHIFISPQALPDSHLREEALKVSAVPGPADQKIGLPSEPSGSYSQREKPIIFYPQGLIESHLPVEALKVTAVPGPADQKTGKASEPSGSYSQREKSSIFYQQELPDSHLTEEGSKVSAVPGVGDQKTGIPIVPTSAYSDGGKSINFYQQALPDRHITEEALNVSASPEPAEQKIGLPTISSTSYSQREKPFIFYPQALPDSQLTEEALKISAVPLSGDQNTREPTAVSAAYSHREKPIISYQQELSGSHLTEEALKGSGVPGTADQKTGLPTVPSNSYSYREKPIISYKQDLTQEALKVLGASRPAGQKTGVPVVTSTSYSHEEKPIISYQQELPDHNEDALKILAVPGPADQKTDIQIVPSSSYSHREGPISSYQKELPDITEKTLEVSTVAGPTEQKTGIRIIPSGSYSYREKGGTFYQHELPDTTEEALKVFTLPVPAGQKTEISAGPSSSYSLKEKPKISTVVLPDDQKTELPTASSSSYSHREKPKNLTVIGPDDQKTPLLTVFRNSYSKRVKPSIFFKQQLPGGHHSEDILKSSSVPVPTDVNSGRPVSSSYSNREKSNILSVQELPEKHLTEDVLKVSTVLEPDNQKTVLPTAPPSFFSHREKPNIFYQQDLPDTHLTEDSLKFSSGLRQADQITGLSTAHPGTYSHSEKNKLVSDHVQRLIDNLDSSNSSIVSNNMPLNSQADDRVIVNKTESSGFEDVGSEEIQYTDNGSKTLKQIQTLLMEAENIALKRCNFPAPLVPFRDVSDISFIQSKKVVCFKDPCTPDESNVDLPLRKPFTEENPSSKYIQKDVNTETNLKCQRGIENWEFISSTTVRSPIQEAESKARVALDETLRQYKAARSVMRSEPEGCSGTFGNKILIPMMTIIKSDSSSDASSCSWDSNSLESVSDVLLNLFPYASPKTSMTDSREEECVSESDDGGGSVDSLAAHVKNLLQCESSLNHAKQILRNAEEEECRVRARAWNLKFNMAHDCGYSISELNEDDRRKVEEIKAKLFGQDDLSKGLQSPRGIGCKPEAVCSHVIIESHEKGCFRTLTAKPPQLDSHPCVFRSAEPLEIIRRQRSPLSWKTRHINLSKSLDQSNPHFRVWNSLQLQSHSPFQNFTGDDFKISKDFRMPFCEKMDPWLSELVEPNCLPPEEMDCHSSSQMLPPESMKKFTSITFSSHRHSKCFSDSSVLKVGVTEDSQCTGGSVGVFNSHFTEEQSPPRDLKQRTSSPSLFKIISHSPDKAVTILAESSRQGQKLSVEHSQQEEKLLEKSNFKGCNSEPSTSTNCNKFKEVHFSGNHTLISMGRPSSAPGLKEKNVALTPNPPSRIFLEQQELFEQSKAPHADHYVRTHHSPPPSPQHQHYVVPNLPCHIFLENRELLEQNRTPHVDHQMRENHSPLPQDQDYMVSDLPSSIFLEQRQLFEQSKAPDIDHHIKKQYSPLPQGQDYEVENNGQHKPKSASNINVETKVNSVVSQSAPNQRTVIISPLSTPPSNRKALSGVRITISPKTSSNLDSGTLDKRFLSLDSASKTRMNSEFNSDLRTISSRSLEPTSKLLTSKPVAHDQESLGFPGPKSSPDFQVKQSLPDGNTVIKDLKTIPFQNSQVVTSRQTQVNFSDLEEYSSPEETPVSSDRSLGEIKPPFSAFSGKLPSSDAVTQITTESPGKAMFSSEIFINSEDRGREISKPSSQKLGKVPVRFASSPSVQQITIPGGTSGAQPSLLPYKPSGSTKMYYVPHLSQIPSSLDSKSDTTIESSHSGSNDAIAPDFPAQVLGTRDDDLASTVNIKHKEGIYSKRAVTKPSSSVGRKPFQKDNADAQVQVHITEDENRSDKKKKKEICNKKAVTKPAQSEEVEFLQKDTAGSIDSVAEKLSAQLQGTKIERLPDTKAIKQKEGIRSKRTCPKEAWTGDKESLQINIEESRCHSEFENTTHSVFRSAKFYFHHPVHLPSDQDFCHESLGRSVFMKHSWKDFFQHHPDKQHTCLPAPYQSEKNKKSDYTRIESVSINVNLENEEVMHPTKSEARDYAKCDKQINDKKKDHQVTPEPTGQHITSLNELWNKYQERQKQQKPPGPSDRKEVSLVERLDRLAKLLQHPITHSLWPLESTQDDSRGHQDAEEWKDRQQQQKNKLQKKKRYKSLEKCHKNIGDLKKSKMLSTHQAGGSNQIKIEQVKFDKYILRKQPGYHYINSTSSDSRPSEDSELLTDTATNILSTTASPEESDILTQTDKELTLHERSSSMSTIDTARLIQAFGQERVCLSPRRIKLYSSLTDHQRRYIEKRSKNKKKALSAGYPQMTSEHTRRKRIQVANHMISSDSVSSSTGSFWSSSSTFCNKQNVHMLNKGVQAGNLEIVSGVRKHTRDVGVIFPTPSCTEVRVEEDSDVTTWSEEKRLVTNYLGDKKLRKNKQSCSEGVSWFVPVENVKSGPKKENLLQHHGPGISWFAPVTNVKPWREPLREQNWQDQHTDSHGSLAGPGRGPLKPFVRATLQESLQLHRPDFISRSGERIKRLKLIVQERKLQNMFQSEREALFNTVREWQGHRDPMRPLPKRGFLAAQKGRPIGKKEMIQRSKRIYEQLPEVQKKREEEKRRLEYKSYRLRAQLYKKKVTNQLLGRKVPWD